MFDEKVGRRWQDVGQQDVRRQVAGQQDVWCQGAGCQGAGQDGRIDGRKSSDGSPWTEVVRRTKVVRGRKSSDGQKSVDRSPTDGSPTYVGRVELHRRCCDGGQRRCTAAMQARAATACVAQRGNAIATRVARELRHCFCSFRRGSVATLLLQHQSRERSDAVVAGIVATLLQLALLRQCCNRRCNNAAALLQLASLRRWSKRRGSAAALLQARSNGKEQRDGATASARGKGRRPEFLFFYFLFFTRQFQRENKSKTERKETGLRNLFPGFVGWLECNTRALSRSNSSSNLRSFRQQQHHTSSNNSRASKVQEICCFQHEATGNRVFLELKWIAKK